MFLAPKFPIVVDKFENVFGKDEKVTCAICKKRIKFDDDIVIMITASYYANLKNFTVYHLPCFLLKLKAIFGNQIELTEKAKRKIVAMKV